MWWLGKITARTSLNDNYVVHFSDDPGPIKVAPSMARGDCRFIQLAHFLRGIQRNVDQSRGEEIGCSGKRLRFNRGALLCWLSFSALRAYLALVSRIFVGSAVNRLGDSCHVFNLCIFCAFH